MGLLFGEMVTIFATYKLISCVSLPVGVQCVSVSVTYHAHMLYYRTWDLILSSLSM